jgi:hypothetical protein
MTEQDAQLKIQRHERRIQRAQREGWAMHPIPLDQYAFNIRMHNLSQLKDAWAQRMHAPP